MICQLSAVFSPSYQDPPVLSSLHLHILGDMLPVILLYGSLLQLVIEFLFIYRDYHYQFVDWPGSHTKLLFSR